jgi:hypothetical protein
MVGAIFLSICIGENCSPLLRWRCAILAGELLVFTLLKLGIGINGMAEKIPDASRESWWE